MKTGHDISVTPLRVRFYGRTNDFLPSEFRHITFAHTVKGRPSVKDTIEALGVPHTEIGGVRVNGTPRPFSCQLSPRDRIRIDPVEDPRGSWLGRRWKGRWAFVVDSHLGKLAHHLRLLGFSSVYYTMFPDEKIVAIASRQKRIVLTRDIGLLKHKAVIWGYWLRSIDPARQIHEVVRRYRLQEDIKPFTLCLECNGKIHRVAKRAVLRRLPPKVREGHAQFYRCDQCRKIYWKGSHYDKLLKLVKRIQQRSRV